MGGESTEEARGGSPASAGAGPGGAARPDYYPLAAALPLARLGYRSRRVLEELSNFSRFVALAVASITAVPALGLRTAVMVVVRQILFTGVQALPFLTVVSLLVGTILVVQSLSQLAKIGAEELVGQIFVLAVVRELGPLLTAIVVIGRSGTAIAAELATNKVSGEIEALETMGIDIYQYVVIPRVLGMVISLFSLVIFFDAVAVLGVFGVAALKLTVPFHLFLQYVMGALSAADIYISAGKSVLFGLTIAFLCSYHGLIVGRSPTEVPQAVTRAVVQSIGLVFVMSGLVSVAFYL
jgi:phospholipid/cholesterol/gamma-HCH transport system permease protein